MISPKSACSCDHVVIGHFIRSALRIDGDKILLQLLDLLNPACAVVKQTAAAGIHARDHAANATLLGIKALGLVFGVPLLAEGKKEIV